MARLFDELDDYLLITDHADLTLPDGDWCVGIWTYVTDNAGTAWQYLISSNLVPNNNNFQLFLQETNAEGNGDDDHWCSYVRDGDGTLATLVSTLAPGADSTWRLIIIQRDTSVSEIQMWFCVKGAAPSKEDSVADAGFAAMNGGDWNIGRRSDGSASRFYGSIACEFFKGNFCLSQTEIEVLGAGRHIREFGYELDVDLPIWGLHSPETDLSGKNHTAAINSAPPLANHAPIVPFMVYWPGMIREHYSPYVPGTPAVIGPLTWTSLFTVPSYQSG